MVRQHGCQRHPEEGGELTQVASSRAVNHAGKACVHGRACALCHLLQESHRCFPSNSVNAF